MSLPATPFVLLDDARPGGPHTLYRNPLAIVTTHALDEVRPALAELREAVRRGMHVAGWLAYEAGHALEAKLAQQTRGGRIPLLWFGVFEQAERLDPDELAALLPDAAGAWAGAPRPNISRRAYEEAFDRVHAWIAAGDIYQANLSFRADVPIQGHPLALYAGLRQTAQVGWGGVVYDGRNWLLSLSPELFFRTDGRRVEARPMKGTAPRGRDEAEDKALLAALAADPKQRAENLMIVDLIRNDLSRVARPGSVVTPALFAVEHYPTVHQMVSEIEAELAPGRDAIDLIEALFPCGSVTGAPKVRAMEIIGEVEADAREAYTGAIGAIGPDGAAAFNVVIRTLALEGGASHARMGLGSAVVADSTADGEWRECLAKGAFVTAGAARFDLFETMRFEADEGIIRLEEHLARLARSAAAFGFVFDRHDIRHQLQVATFPLTAPARLRLMLGRSGAMAVEVRDLPPPPAEPVAVQVATLPVDPADFRLRHKTTDRAFYADARAKAGTFEMLFVRPDGLLTEGSFTNLFVPRDGKLVTPPLHLGLLPGILRAALIAQGDAVEANLTVADLQGEFFIGNDLRGLMKARLAASKP
ncbi:aminodeoxychorismate synthase component I [Sphingomonas crusticola]|uniref:aminodeoxychorismate synthase component I n=1 Tax=Sphingomonas crusticola TaxID=1697973 RepID=UPI0013C333B1|nr:aminodeoxychorismate synthase component I [Sphingomonas crusticola]